MVSRFIERLFYRHPWVQQGDARYCPCCDRSQVFVSDCGGWSTGWWEDVKDRRAHATCE